MRYTLKPLGQLYGKGDPGRPVDPQDSWFTPLFLAIEESIVDYDDEVSNLSDGQVALALDLMGANPQGDVRHDPLALRIQSRLRELLSLTDYSRDEVRQAIRKVRKSVERHSRLSGQRGYLEFIHEWIHA